MAAAITLGAIYNLTGGQAGLDVPSANGARLAVAEANDGGGVLGQPVDLIVLDGATEPAVLAAQTARLLDEHPEVSALFGLSDTDAVLAAAGACATLERLFVTSGATSPHLPEQVQTYLYLACFGDNVQAAAAAGYAFNQLGARTAAIIFRREDTFTELLQGYFAASFTALGGAITGASSYVSLDEIDAIALTVPAVDVIFLSAAPDDVIDALTRLRAGGRTTPIIGGDSFDLGDAWAHHPALADIAFTTHAYVDSTHPDPAMAAFIQAYETANPGHEANAFAALGYDTARLILAAIRAAKGSDPAAVLAALPSMSTFHGLTGTIDYVDGSHIPTKSVTVLRADSGRVSLAAQLTPAAVPQP
jgi:branched-chain amino acid transport system substrate-binding protein